MQLSLEMPCFIKEPARAEFLTCKLIEKMMPAKMLKPLHAADQQ